MQQWNAYYYKERAGKIVSNAIFQVQADTIRQAVELACEKVGVAFLPGHSYGMGYMLNDDHYYCYGGGGYESDYCDNIKVAAIDEPLWLSTDF
jgi:hypothetical protein